MKWKYLKYAFFMLFLSCYEGWEYEKGGKAGEPESEPENKPIHYILLNTFSPQTSAYDEPLCGLNSSHLNYRMNEWTLRINAMVEGLKKMSETFVHVDTKLSGNDCVTLSPFITFPTNLEPWGNSPAPTPDPKERRTIQIRASFWEGEIVLGPNLNMKFLYHWAAWQQMFNSGRKVSSYTYFNLPTAYNGFFADWRQNSPVVAGNLRTLSHSGINQPDPTPSGLDKRKSNIEKETAEFLTWVAKDE